jgi:[ribosomal protein S5]-alanine N-acetyltransferase
VCRVVVRPPVPQDRDEFLGLMRASRALHRPWAYPPITEEAWAAYVGRAGDGRTEPLLVCRRDDDAIVGFANLSEILRGGMHSAFLGYAGGAGFGGRGYMTEGVRLVLRHAFTTLNLHRVEANIQPGNRPSIALAERVGFRHEGFSPRYLKIGGRWCDHERYAITIEDWEADGAAALAQAPAAATEG